MACGGGVEAALQPLRPMCHCVRAAPARCCRAADTTRKHDRRPPTRPIEPPSDLPVDRPAGADDVRRFAPVVRSGAPGFATFRVRCRHELLSVGPRAHASPKARSLLRKGDAVDGLYCVVAGCLRVTTTAADGRQAMLAIAEPPQWFGEIALVRRRASVSHDVWASAPTTLLQVPRARLLALLEATPAHWHALGLLLTHKLRAAFAVPSRRPRC